MKNMNFKIYKDTLRKVLSFRNEWDSEDWNDSYVAFKECVNGYYRKEYVQKHSGIYLATEWAKEFYQDATPETHSYWVA